MIDLRTADYTSFSITAVERSQLATVAVDLRARDQPIVFANDAFLRLSGYERHEVVGRNCRFLQCPATDPATIKAMRRTIDERREGYFELLNRRKDGSSFWNGLHIGPATDANGADLFFGTQRDVTAEVERRERESAMTDELRHRLGNMLSIVNVIVRTTNAEGEDGEAGPEALRTALLGKLKTLAAANALIYPPMRGRGTRAPVAPVMARADVSHQMSHEASLASTTSADVGTVVRTVLAPLDPDRVVAVDGPPAWVTREAIISMALALHELATNSMNHGALSGGGGTIRLAWRETGGRIAFDWVETGLASDAGAGAPGMGTSLLRAIVRTSQRHDAGHEREPGAVRCLFDVQPG